MYSIFLDLIFLLLVQKYRVVNSLIGFLSEKLVLCKKWANEHFAKKNPSALLIFGERPVRFAHGCSFLVSDLSYSLTVAHLSWPTWAICSHGCFKKRKWANGSFKKKTYKKTFKNVPKIWFYSKKFERIAPFFYLSEWAIRTQKTERFAVLSWATWANRSLSLFCHEQPERFNHGCSFVMSDLSNLLTVPHFSWTIWAIHSQSLICPQWSEQMSNEQMSEIPTLQK